MTHGCIRRAKIVAPSETNQRRRIHEPQMPPHQFGKSLLGVFFGIAAEQFGIIRHGGSQLTAAPAKTEQTKCSPAPEKFTSIPKSQPPSALSVPPVV